MMYFEAPLCRSIIPICDVSHYDPSPMMIMMVGPWLGSTIGIQMQHLFIKLANVKLSVGTNCKMAMSENGYTVFINEFQKNNHIGGKKNTDLLDLWTRGPIKTFERQRAISKKAIGPVHLINASGKYY